MSEYDRIAKAFHAGARGKFRRVNGKTLFIRSEDDKVTKGPDEHKGKTMVMKDTTAAGLAADVGTPSAEVLLTDKPKACGHDKNEACACGVEKAACPGGCECPNEALCKQNTHCDCSLGHLAKMDSLISRMKTRAQRTTDLS